MSQYCFRRGKEHIIRDDADNVLFKVKKSNFVQANVRIVDATGDGVDTPSALTGNVTLVLGTSARFQQLDPGGSHRNVTLPAVTNNAGLDYVIVNKADAAENLVVKNAGGSTIITINQAEVGWVFTDGTSWYGVVVSENAITAPTLDSAFTAGNVITGATGSGATTALRVGDGTDYIEMYAESGSNMATITTNSGTGLTIATVGTGDITIAPAGGDIAMTGNVDISGTLIAGTGDAFQVSAAGAVTCLSLTATGAIYQAAIAAAAAGNVNLTIDAAGSGTITIGGTSTGSIILSRALSTTGAILLGTNNQLQFRDSGQYIYSSAASTLGIVSAGGVNITAAAASAWAFSGGAFTLAVTSQNLTISTASSGTLALSSAAAMTLASTTLGITNTNAVTWAVSGGAFGLTVTSQNLTITTATSGTLALVSAGVLNMSGVGASLWTVSTGNLTISTTTSGTLAISAVAAMTIGSTTLGLTTTGAVTWAASGGAFGLTVTGQALSISTASSGTLTITSAAILAINGVATNITTTGAVAWAASGGAFGITVTGQALTISTASSGTLTITSAAILAINGVATNITTTGAVAWAASGGAFGITVTSQNLTLTTATSGTLALVSAGVLNMSGVGASLWTVSTGNLTISTTTSGTLAISAVAALTISGAATTLTTTGVVAWNASGGAFGITVTSNNLTITTATSGTLALVSAGVLNMSGVGASLWTVSTGNLTISTTTSGILAITSAGVMNLTGTTVASLSRMTTTDGVASGTARVVGGRAYSKVSDTTTGAPETTEAAIGAYTIPASTLKEGSVVHLKFGVFVTQANDADTLTVRLRLGSTTLTGTALFTGTATNATANDVMYGDFTIISRAAAGATVACSAYGLANLVEAASGTAAPQIHRMAPTNFKTDGDLFLEVTADWSADNAANDATCEFMTVEIL